jgi:hypothetical protein
MVTREERRSLVKYLGVYRIATYLLVLFCAGHTAGGMLAQKSLGAESDAVFSSMKSVHFDFNGGDCTWYGFWFAFGLTASVFLLFSAVAAWTLAALSPSHWSVVAPIAWALFASHVCNAVLSWGYFFAGPGVLSTVIAILLGIGAFRNGRGQAASPPRPA